jgi:hypothetical protein
MSSILIYSKYSLSCKMLIEELQRYRIPVLMVCIDNKSLRDKLTRGNIAITYVPCIMNVLNDGGVELYEGQQAFEWFNFVRTQIYGEDIQEQGIQGNMLNGEETEMQSKSQGENTSETQSEMRSETQSEPEDNNEESFEDDHEEALSEDKTPPVLPPRKNTKAKIRQPDKVKRVSIDDLEGDERYQTKPQPKRVPSSNKGEYDESEQYYGDEQPDVKRQESGKALKTNTQQKASADPHGTMAKVKELERQRQEIEDMFPQRNRPLNPR